jgi:hypothetical protein
MILVVLALRYVCSVLSIEILCFKSLLTVLVCLGQVQIESARHAAVSLALRFILFIYCSVSF